MTDLIDITRPHLENIAEHTNRKRKPPDAEVESVEDIVQYAMFEYFARAYANNPVLSRQALLTDVSKKFNQPIFQIERLHKRFRWDSRAKKLLIEGGPSSIPTEHNDILDEMIANTSLIAKLGTKLISEYLTNAKSNLLTPRDVFKLGMLVVECARTASECIGGGKNNQLQGQMVKLVINE